MGTESHPKNALAAIFVAKTRKPGRYADWNGLYLIIEPSGSRRWEQRILIRGKRRTLGLGGYPLVSLAAAREKALENRRVCNFHSAGVNRVESCTLGVRIHDPDRSSVRRSHRRHMAGNRSDRLHMDRSGRTHEGGSRTPRSAFQSGGRDPDRSTDTW